jgi:hypothetical protein
MTMFGEIIYSIIIGLFLEEVQNQQSDRDRFKQIARGGDSAGNFPSWGIKETNDLAEPELHNLVHHLAVKQGTNQRLAIMGHTRKSNQKEVNYISLLIRLESTPALSGGDTQIARGMEESGLSSLHKLLHSLLTSRIRSN